MSNPVIFKAKMTWDDETTSKVSMKVHCLDDFIHARPEDTIAVEDEEGNQHMVWKVSLSNFELET